MHKTPISFMPLIIESFIKASKKIKHLQKPKKAFVSTIKQQNFAL